VASGGTGTFPAETAVFIGYTLLDDDGGETTLAPAITLTTRDALPDPEDGPGAVIDYTGGVLRADTYYYALTFSDGSGGETLVGPSVAVEREPGFASGQVQLTGMATLAAAAGAPAWRMYRAAGGGRLAFLTQGTSNSFTDDGTVPCDCNVSPPVRNITNGANRIRVTVPAAPAASAFSVYLSETGDFTSPAFAGTYPMSSAGTPIVYDGFDVDDGAPPDVSTSVQGASKIDPDTELLDWNWKRSVATTAELPVGSAGDVRLVRTTGSLYAVLGSAAHAPGDWSPLVGADGLTTVIVDPDTEVGVTAIEFRGDGATLEREGDTAVVNLPVASGGGGGGGGGGTVNTVIVGAGTEADVTAIAFVADGATLTRSGDMAVVEIPVGSGGGGGGGGGALRARETVVLLASASVAPAAHFSSAAAVAPGYRVLQASLTTGSQGRVRLYDRAARRDADVARSSSTPPTGDHGLMLDVDVASAAATNLAPPAEGYNLDSPASDLIYYTLTNEGGSSVALEAELVLVQTEAL
jgi:hypothetical protein